MHARPVKLGQMLTSLIERGGYSRNRQQILAEVGVSAAALSQYARDETRPSFNKLVALAGFFDVSIDYLVHGEPARTTRDEEPLGLHLNYAMTDVQARAQRHAALVTRIGRVLADGIDDVARELAASPTASREGLIQDDEMLRLERYGQRADILTMDLKPDVVGTQENPVGGRFFHVVSSNLLRGCAYRFLVAEGDEREASVGKFRALLTAHIGGDRVHQACEFRAAMAPVMFGAGFYRLNVAALALEDPALHAQFSGYVDDDGWFGYAMRSTAESESDMVMDRCHVRSAHDTFETLWSAATPL